MGGALTVLSLTMVPEADAGVVWYGLPPLEYVDASKIKAPLMAHWADAGQAFPIAGVDALEAKLRAAGVRYTGHRYLAHHAFANETAQGPRRIAITQYDAAWAQLAWDRSFASSAATWAERPGPARLRRPSVRRRRARAFICRRSATASGAGWPSPAPATLNTRTVCVSTPAWPLSCGGPPPPVPPARRSAA
jgi:hypothetical protein